MSPQTYAEKDGPTIYTSSSVQPSLHSCSSIPALRSSAKEGIRLPDLTAIGLVGFVLANTPATVMLLGWHGAGGTDGKEAASIGVYIYFGCLLELVCGIGQWINGETFNAIVFLSLGAYFGASGVMMVPFFNAVSGYGTTSEGLEAYNNSYASFLISMGVLLLLFTLASLRVDFCHVFLFACFTICFPCLAASYQYAGKGNDHMARVLRMWGAATSLMGTIMAWYLLLGSILESVDPRLSWPKGDLKRLFGILKKHRAANDHGIP